MCLLLYLNLSEFFCFGRQTDKDEEEIMSLEGKPVKKELEP